jgi:transcription antitermination factor NusG
MPLFNKHTLIVNPNVFFMTTEKNWYAIYTKPRWEKKTAELLSKKRIESYCPLNKVVRTWSDRKKTILEPLFKSYVFINITEKEQTYVRQTDGVLNFVYWLGKPAVIKTPEIEAIRDFLEEYQNVHLEHVDVNINDTVKIKRGPLMEQEGDVLEIKNRTVKVYLPSMGYALIAEVEKANVEVLTRANVFKRNNVSGLYYQQA